MKRYWAAVSCSVFGAPARALSDKFRKLAAEDSNLLVRTRAAEFLALHEKTNPMPVLVDVLGKTRNAVQANEILNTVVMLRDGRHRYDLPIKREHVHQSIRDTTDVKRRLDYLTSERGRGERWVRPKQIRRNRKRGKKAEQ